MIILSSQEPRLLYQILPRIRISIGLFKEMLPPRMQVKLRLNAECHMEAMCGPKPETGIQFDPPSRNLSVGSGAIMDDNSMHCLEFKCDYRLQLWHAEIEEQRRCIRMVRVIQVDLGGHLPSPPGPPPFVLPSIFSFLNYSPTYYF